MADVELTPTERDALRGLGQGQVPAVVERLITARVARTRAEVWREAYDAFASDHARDLARRTLHA